MENLIDKIELSNDEKIQYCLDKFNSSDAETQWRFIRYFNDSGILIFGDNSVKFKLEESGESIEYTLSEFVELKYVETLLKAFGLNYKIE